MNNTTALIARYKQLANLLNVAQKSIADTNQALHAKYGPLATVHVKETQLILELAHQQAKELEAEFQHSSLNVLKNYPQR